jgi:nicotinamidase/pyrazinamidase
MKDDSAHGEHTPELPLQAGDALLIVDMQRDFLPGGSLAVARGEVIVEALNRCIETFAARGLPVLASRDWHPRGHCSFRQAGGPWPEHCIAGTPGAEFAAGLRLPTDASIVSKGVLPGSDAYSAFEGTSLHATLRQRGVSRLFVGGLATDYCVASTVADALRLGYRVVLLRDAIAAVDVQPGDGEAAIARMQAAGACLAGGETLSRAARTSRTARAAGAPGRSAP